MWPPAPGHCPALLPGGKPTRLSSPRLCLHTGDQPKACSREQGICEQPFPLQAADVCWERSYCRDVITHLWMIHRSPCLALGLTASGLCSLWPTRLWFLQGGFMPSFPLMLGTGFQGDRLGVRSPGPLFILLYLYFAKKSWVSPATSFPSASPWPTVSAVPRGLSCPLFILQWVMPEDLKGFQTHPQHEIFFRQSRFQSMDVAPVSHPQLD